MKTKEKINFLGIIMNLFQVLTNSYKIFYKRYKNQLQVKYLKLQDFLGRPTLDTSMWVLIYCLSQISYIYLPNPSARAEYDTRSIFKRSLTG